jgi:uncharacterized protein (DUF924 family)
MRPALSPEEIHHFWFVEAAGYSGFDRPGGFLNIWFERNRLFDMAVRDRLGPAFFRARPDGVKNWRETPLGGLARILLFDQVPRNVLRGRAGAFATDAQARETARHMLRWGHDQELGRMERLFCYMPFQHSEDMQDQNLAVELYGALGFAEEYARAHRDVIAEFGRFPHRNEALGRNSTDAEIEYINTPGTGF